MSNMTLRHPAFVTFTSGVSTAFLSSSTATTRTCSFLTPTPIATPARHPQRSFLAVRCCVESTNSGNPSFNERGEALVRAAMLSDVDQIDTLLSSSPGADETFVVSYSSELSTSRMTALMWAAAEGHEGITRSLLSAGAEAGINNRNSNGDSALLLAMENMPNTNPFPAPPPGFPGAPNLQSKSSTFQQSSPLPQRAPKFVTSGHINVINILLDHGADVSIRISTGESLLHLAARRGQIGLMRQLLAKGLSLNDVSNYAMESPLHTTARQSHVEATRLLCALGADVDAKNAFGWTPLIWAAASGWEDVVSVLLEYNADVNAKAKTGPDGKETTTALKESRKSARPESISRLLIKAGAIE